MTGTQALVRLPMMQYQRDLKVGLNTGCYISGYRGSPLGGYDKALWQAKNFLDKHNIYFNPGVNEDLAATAVWGTQQIGLAGDTNFDGVFSIWYGKGPGVDRSMDVLKHANTAGSAKYGGVLALAGDDHICASSTLPHQSEYDFAAAHIPVLNPAGVQEFIDYGLFGWALSRYSGLWCSMVCIAETLDSSAIVSINPHRLQFVEPIDYKMPVNGLNIRWPDPPMDQESRLHELKHDAALAFTRANNIDQEIMGSGTNKKIGIVTTGKAYLDVRQALDEIGINDLEASKIGLGLYKVGMVWPLEPSRLKEFSQGLDEVLVVEEKRGLLEDQIKNILYDLKDEDRPVVTGKKDLTGNWQLKSAGEIDPSMIIKAISKRFGEIEGFKKANELVKKIKSNEAKISLISSNIAERSPYFCSGCPHNTSTKVPEGSRAIAGIGCHYMAQWMDRATESAHHMGGEGAGWIGQAPFVNTKHVFQNIGDGTYYHSGILAIRAAVAAKVNITYKILYNDAVAMTGGQPMDGPLSTEKITQQVAAEGVNKIAVVSDEPHKYPINNRFAPGVTIHHRDELDCVQREFRKIEGVSAIIYDQVCATEKRRRRKRGTLPKANWQVVINPHICEGCGDCGIASNCLSLHPLETELGRKRVIDQSSCNMDYSCIKGFCPSFVLIKGGKIKNKINTNSEEKPKLLPEPDKPDCDKPYSIYVTGIGGMGIVTLSAIIGISAKIDGKSATVLDKAGLAQKYGAVTSHIKIANDSNVLHAVRIANNAANLVLGADLIVSASPESIAKIEADTTKAIINSSQTVTGDFTRNPDINYSQKSIENSIKSSLLSSNVEFINATEIVSSIIGDAIYTNLFLLGFAYQRGLIPLEARSIEKAIELNEVTVEKNLLAFRSGRTHAHKMSTSIPSNSQSNYSQEFSKNIDAAVDFRYQDLISYQNKSYAEKYKNLLHAVKICEGRVFKESSELHREVAISYYKLLAYKDEYEVARLFTDGRFKSEIKNQFEGNFSWHFHLAPPLLAKRDPATGQLQKNLYGPKMFHIFNIIKHLKFLRHTPFDLFGWSQERKKERQLILEFERDINFILTKLSPDNYRTAIEIAKLPQKIRGFGHVKEKTISVFEQEKTILFRSFNHSNLKHRAAE
tara:strand:+ start:1407 stop:4817 length:3411 start_codon:yes stop_codon:yes gene_type:complete